MKWVGVDAPHDDVAGGCGRALPTVGEVEGVAPSGANDFCVRSRPDTRGLGSRGLATHITWWLTSFRLTL